MEVFKSGFTAEQMEYALSAVPSIGENGNWWIGDTDTGVFAGGVDVTGAEIGQTIKVAAVDENGRPTAWEAANLSEWKTLVSLTVEEEIDWMEITTDVDGNSFDFSYVSEVIVYINATGACGGGYYPNITLGNAIIGSPVQFAVGEDIINVASMHAVFFNGGMRSVNVATAGNNYETFNVTGKVASIEWNREPKLVVSNTVLLPGARLLILAR
jgi:hypothetical protein